MSELEQEIKDAIAKSMPAQVGDVLKDRLEQAVKDAVTVLRLERLVSNMKDREYERTTTIDTLEKAAQNYANIKVREEEVLKREQEATLNKYKVVAAEEKVSLVNNLAEIMFRNTRTKYVSNTSGYRDVTVPQYTGDVSSKQPEHFDSTTTLKEVDE